MLDQIHDATPAIDLAPAAPNTELLEDIEVLTKARGILVDEWTSGAFCRVSADGKIGYCAQGAVMKAAGVNVTPYPVAGGFSAWATDMCAQLRKPHINRLIKELDTDARANGRGRTIMGLNDTQGQEATLASFDKTIARLKSQL